MWGGGHMFGMGIGWIFWALLIVAVIWILVRSTMQQNASRESVEDKSNAGESARELLDKRYARGDIDEDEYKQKKKNMAS